MIEQIVNQHCPYEWTFADFSDYKVCDVPSYSSEYENFKIALSYSFNEGIERIVRVENPYLYGQFLLKKEEYETRGYCSIKQLYHDTASFKVDSILSTNLDWRLANRVKYGRGVSFSPSPAYANKESSRSNGTARAMIVADVLVQNAQLVATTVNLPDTNYDTTIGNCSQVYVKYYDDEFYPKYVIYYKSKIIPYVRRRRYF